MLARLLEVIVLLLVVRSAWKVLRNLVTINTGATRTTAAGEPRAVKLVRDPVCGTYVSPDSALSLKARRGTEYFCSAECRDKRLHEHAS